MELEINGKVYRFKFGLGFVRYIDGKSSIEQNGMQFGVGLENLIPNLMSGSVVTLADCLFAANRTENPRATQLIIDNYLEDEETDIDAVFDMVLDELKKSNDTKKKAVDLIEEIEKEIEKATKN